jgi:uncharacterized protein (DUF983 family)
MHDRCCACDEPFEREPGQRFGAVYINLGLTAVLTATGFLLTERLTQLPLFQQQILWSAMAALGPFVFFRFAKGVWTGLVFLGEGVYLDWPSR